MNGLFYFDGLGHQELENIAQDGIYRVCVAGWMDGWMDGSDGSYPSDCFNY